ncbi:MULTISPECIES: two-component system sensor histidine kinase NtrB [Paenibacillus]|uniref:two-component system sensor histidine kinase NtrB n=1 Tax=Paenibacillus TaxID=44249 RepID=UPI0022806FA9|nr:ATP-binding protein [Paenibacillus alvei]MCY7484810.1 ATP-binding protein [Paenibacillus alvei]
MTTDCKLQERNESEWRQRYSKELWNYIMNGDEHSLVVARELATELSPLEPQQNLLSVHEDAMFTVLAHVDLNDGVKALHRSFLFFIEWIIAMKTEERGKEGIAVALNPIREPWIQSAQALFSTKSVRDKYENVLQHMDSGIVLFDSSGVLSFINVETSKLLDVPRKALVGCSLRELLFHPLLKRDKRKMLLRLYKDTILQRKRYHEFSDRLDRHYLVTVTYGDQMDGDYLFSIKDVSDFKRIEQTAYQNDKLAILGKIAAAIAHEIRNPLTSIRGFIQLLRPHLMQLGKEEYAKIILAEIDRANDIIFEFLNSSKPSAPMTSEVPVSSLLREVVLLTESDAVMKGCEIELVDNSASGSLSVSIDVKQIKQVILNMIRNAIDAIDEVADVRKGQIRIVTEREGRFVKIHIRDNGKGMSLKTMERLFDPFFTTKADGTGLGLSVSYRIIKNHGGMIEVDSQEGEWTLFTIRLPIA